MVWHLSSGRNAFIYAPHIVGRDTPAATLWDIESRYAKPIILGDTLRLQWSIEEKTPDVNQLGFGTVRTAYKLINQEGVTEYDGAVTTKVRMRHAESTKLQFKPGAPFEFKEFVPDFDKVYVTEEKVSFLAPAKIGDIIRCRTRFDAIRISKTKPDRGIITFRQQAINQKDEVLTEIQTLFMIPTKAGAAQLHETTWVFSTTKSS
jgi:acyl dehydratase